MQRINLAALGCTVNKVEKKFLSQNKFSLPARKCISGKKVPLTRGSSGKTSGTFALREKSNFFLSIVFQNVFCFEKKLGMSW